MPDVNANLNPGLQWLKQNSTYKKNIYVVYNYKIIYPYTTLTLLEVLILFLATCFGSYTEPSSGQSSEWFVCKIGCAVKATRFRVKNSS